MVFKGFGYLGFVYFHQSLIFFWGVFSLMARLVLPCKGSGYVRTSLLGLISSAPVIILILFNHYIYSILFVCVSGYGVLFSFLILFMYLYSTSNLFCANVSGFWTNYRPSKKKYIHTYIYIYMYVYMYRKWYWFF